MYRFLVVLTVVFLTCTSTPSSMAQADALLIVEKAFDYWRGVSSYAEFSMTIHRSDFERTMVMKGWTKGRSDALF